MTEPTGPGMGENAVPDLVGTVLAGRYRLLKLLGEGAMGAVYLGEHLRIGRHDAIKVLRKGLTSDAESIARFNRGARNLSAIRHSNVCTLYDYGETADGSPFLALELIDGESLKDLVTREHALDPPRALSIALQTANALDAAHHAGIVHRDLKPANIMLERGRDGGDVVKVVDFDIAKGPEAEGGEEVTRLGFVVGTPEYMSPEQLTGEKLDGRSDIYSLGVTLFRMLTGLLPFRGTDTQTIMIERLTEHPLSLVDVRPDLRFPPQLQQILDRTLARDRGERYARAADVVRDLGLVLRLYEDTPTVAATPSSAGREVPETRVTASGRQPSSAPVTPRRVPVWLIAAGVLVVGAAGVTAMLIKGGSGAGLTGGEDQALELGQTPPDSGTRVVVSDSTGRGDDAGGGSPGRQSTSGGTGDTGRQDTGGGTRGTGGGSNPPDPEPPQPETQPVSPRLMAANAIDVLNDLQDRMSDNSELGVTTNRTIVDAVADTAMRLLNADGMSRADSALAAFTRGMAALGQRDRAACERWLGLAVTLGHTSASRLRENCSEIGG